MPHLLRTAALLAALALPLASAHAQEATRDPAGHLQLGARLGFNRAILSPPQDGPGEVQFMSGTAFVGFGFTGGVYARYVALDFLALQLDALFSYEQGTGFEDDGTYRRELTLSSSRIRIPLTLLAGYNHPDFSIEAGLGPELVLPLSVSGELSESASIPPEDRLTLGVTTAPTLGLGFRLQGAYHLTHTLHLPLALHLTWIPTVPDSSRARFDAFASPQNPGDLIVEFDITFHVTAGLAYELF